MSVGGSTVTWEKGNKIYYTYSAANEKITPSTSHS